MLKSFKKYIIPIVDTWGRFDSALQILSFLGLDWKSWVVLIGTFILNFFQATMTPAESGITIAVTLILACCVVALIEYRRRHKLLAAETSGRWPFNLSISSPTQELLDKYLPRVHSKPKTKSEHPNKPIVISTENDRTTFDPATGITTRTEQPDRKQWLQQETGKTSSLHVEFKRPSNFVLGI